MDKRIKVVLKQRWWDDNRAKTLIDRGNVGKALKTFEATAKLVAIAKGLERLQRITAAENACKALRVAAATTARACVTALHGDTQWVLKNSFLKAVEEQEKVLGKTRDKYKAEIQALSLDEFYNDRTMRVMLSGACEKEYAANNLDFLVAAKWGRKRDQATFDTFIADEGRKQVNLPAGAFNGLSEANQRNALAGSRHWDDAVKAIADLMENDTLRRLKSAICDGTYTPPRR